MFTGFTKYLILFSILSFFSFKDVSSAQLKETKSEIAKQKTENVSAELSQNYPNPFNSTTKIKFTIKQQGYVVLKVYNLLGKEITRLVDEKKAPGEYEVSFNADNLPSGIYLYQLNVNGNILTRRFILLK